MAKVCYYEYEDDSYNDQINSINEKKQLKKFKKGCLEMLPRKKTTRPIKSTRNFNA